MDATTQIIVTLQTGEIGTVEKTWTKATPNRAKFRITDPRTCIFILNADYGADKLYKIPIKDVQVRGTNGKFTNASERKTLEYGVYFFNLKDVQ